MICVFVDGFDESFLEGLSVVTIGLEVGVRLSKA